MSKIKQYEATKKIKNYQEAKSQTNFRAFRTDDPPGPQLKWKSCIIYTKALSRGPKRLCLNRKGLTCGRIESILYSPHSHKTVKSIGKRVEIMVLRLRALDVFPEDTGPIFYIHILTHHCL